VAAARDAPEFLEREKIPARDGAREPGSRRQLRDGQRRRLGGKGFDHRETALEPLNVLALVLDHVRYADGMFACRASDTQHRVPPPGARITRRRSVR
jgi:hypothetical protein